MAKTQHDLTGHTLGQYTITERLGRGGMADVYKAFHPKLEVYRAIKVIRPEFVTAEDFRERFQKEAQSVASLRHSNIVQIHDFGEEDDSYYMVMEFVEGQDLKRVIKAEGKIRPIRRAVEIVEQVADALHYAHSRGLIHRDIKPENIMINADGLPILMDFGIAKLLTANTQLTQTGMGIGTPSYMAPEQAKALPDIGPQADIYSLAVVLYEMLTGQVPFSADTPMAVMLKAINDPMPMPRKFSTDISEDLQQVILKGTAKDLENRFSTAKRFQKALREALEQEPEADATVAATQVAETEVVGAGSGEEAAAEEPQGAGTRPTRQRREPAGRESRGAFGAWVLIVAVVALAGIGGALWYFQPVEPEKIADEPNGARVDRVEGPAVAAGDSETDVGADTRAAVRVVDDEQRPDSLPGGEAEEARQVSEAGVLDGGAISPGEQIRGETTAPGQAVAYAFEGEAGQTIFLDQLEDGAAEFTLTAPDGETRVFRTLGDHGPVTLEQAGTYTLTARPGSDQSEFEFSVRELDTPVIDGGSVALNQRVSGGTEAPGQRVKYTLKADAGQPIQFDLASASAETEFTLTAPDGGARVFSTQSDHGPVTLDRAGTYTLEADPVDDAVAQFDFTVRRWQPPMTDGGYLEMGRVVREQFPVAGRAMFFRFDAQAGETIFFDHVDNNEGTRRIDFRLLAPDGGRVFQAQGDHGPVTLDHSGSYRLVADPRDSRVSRFEFILWQLDPARIEGGVVQLGRLVEGETRVPGQTVSYTFYGNAGQTIVFDHEESTETTEFSLVAPDGSTELFTTRGDGGPVTLGESGAYRLVADPQGDWVSKFKFTVRPAGAG